MNTIPEVFVQSAEKHSESPCLLYKKDHTFSEVPYKRLLNLVENFTLSLQEIGVKKGDRIAILSENRPEWVVSDLAAMSLGAMLAPIHTSLTAEQVKEIIYQIEPAIIVVSEKKLLKKLLEIKKQIDKKTLIVYYNTELKEDLSEFKNDKFHFIEALKMLPHKKHTDRYRQIIKEIKENDTANIIFTIGPNGKYRGVELSHKNLISNALGTIENVYIRPDDKFLSVLPLTHAFEKMAGYYIPLIQGASIAYLTDITKFSAFAQEYRPSVIIGVPRLYEKSYKKILDTSGKSKVTNFLLHKGIDYGKRNGNRKKLPKKIYDRLVYKKVRDNFGGNLRFMISGGAALNPEVGHFFNITGTPILEGYGLTEFSPIVSVNKPDNNKIGTVGFPLPNAQVKIADDGEILLKGPSVMKGYQSNGSGPQLDLEKGWFKTGDLGEFDNEGFLKVIGRKKEIIVLSTGKNISPRYIESQITLSEFIRQAVVLGDDMKHIAALLVPNFAKLKRKFGLKTNQEVLTNKEVKTFVQKEINKHLAGFPSYEQVKKFSLISTAFTKENRFLNDDYSLNRDKINAVFRNVIEGLYANGH